MMSMPVPGVNGTTTLIGWTDRPCASAAGAGDSAHAARLILKMTPCIAGIVAVSAPGRLGAASHSSPTFALGRKKG